MTLVDPGKPSGSPDRRSSSGSRPPAHWLAALVLGAALLEAGSASAKTQRLAVVIGNNLGLASEDPLKYAEREASALATTLLEIGGVRPHDLYLLLGKRSEDAWRALDEISRRASDIDRRDVVFLIFYYSGHGSAEALHLAGTRLNHRQLRDRLRTIRARTVVAFVDACHSGALVRQKGIQRRPMFQIQLDQGEVAQGRVFITSSAELEASAEADDVRGSYFSHYLISGLRGDADGNKDGSVDLAEVYQYAYRRTLLKSIASRAGTQHPSFEYDLRGSGQVLLSWPVKAETGLSLGPELSGTYLIVSKHGRQVMAEVTVRAGETRYIALAPQSYLVKKRVNGGHLVGGVNLTWGGRARLHEQGMVFVSHEASAKKGEDVVLAPNELTAAFDLSSGVAAGNPFLLGARLGYRRAVVGRFAVGVALSYKEGRLSTAEQSLSTRGTLVEVSGAYRKRWRTLTLSTGAWLDTGIVWQVVPGLEDRRSLVFGGGIGAGLSWMVADPLTLNLDGRGGIEAVKVSGSYGVRPDLGVSIGPGFSF